MKIQPVNTDIHQNDATQTTMPPKKGELTGHSVSWTKDLGNALLFGACAVGLVLVARYLFFSNPFFSSELPKKEKSIGDALQDCIGKPDEACQSLIANHFKTAVKDKFVLSISSMIAEKCFSMPDKACQSVVRDALPFLLANSENTDSWSGAVSFTEKCIKTQNPECLAKVAEYAQLLFQKEIIDDTFIAQFCKDKHDIACSALRLRAIEFYKNNKDDEIIKRIASQCIGQNTPECRSIIHDTFPTLFQNNPQSFDTFKFATSCIGKENQVVQEAISKLKSNGDMNIAAHIVSKCYELKDQACTSYVRDNHPDILTSTSFLTWPYIRKNQVIKQVFSELVSSEKLHSYAKLIANECFVENDKPCLSFIQANHPEFLKDKDSGWLSWIKEKL